MVRHGRSRWFEHLDSGVRKFGKYKGGGVICRGRDRKTWGKCGKQDLDLLGLTWSR